MLSAFSFELKLITMQTLGNYITGRWIEGKGEGQVLSDAVSGIPLYRAGTEGLDFQEILQYAREVGNPILCAK